MRARRASVGASAAPPAAPPAAPDQPGWRRLPPTRQERLADLGIAVLFVAAAAGSTALYRVAGLWTSPAPDAVAAVWIVAIAAPIALRRSQPIVAGAVISAAFMVGGIAQVPEVLVSNILLFLALYSIGAWAPQRRAATIARAVIVVGMLVWLIVEMYETAVHPEAAPQLSRTGAFSSLVAFQIIQLVINAVYFAGAWVLGERAWAAARERALLVQRTAELEAEREHSAAQAVTLERLRIARELHDVVAHHVSVMGIQSGAARTVLDADPDAARAALATVEETSRSAIDELHRLLFTLRDEDRTDAAAPSPGLRDLPDLVAASREAGVPTELTVVGEPRPLPPGADVNLFRVAQEALTNVRKHAGSGGTADVRLRFGDAAVELEVGSTGRVPARPSRHGLGLVGMRERVAASGGVLEAGPRSRGGFLVRAAVPLPGAGSGSAASGASSASASSAAPVAPGARS